MQDVERNSMPMKANSVNIAHFPAITEVLRMNSEKLQKISTYKVTLAVLKKWRKDGIISEHEFRKCELKLPKNSIYLCAVYIVKLLDFRSLLI